MEFNQDLIFTISELENNLNAQKQSLNFVDEQINDLGNLEAKILAVDINKEGPLLSSLGNGVFAEFDLRSKNLFVQVGSGIVIRKTPKDTLKTVREQLERLRTVRQQLLSSIDVLNSQLYSIIGEIENSRSA